MSYPLNEGDALPEFSAEDQNGQTISNQDLKGQFTVLYFYPKDNTPGCTKEACDFRDRLPEFTNLGVQVFGISPDNAASHQKFIQKYKLSFPLLVDENHEICEKFGVWREKKFMGMKYKGVERTTYIIDPEGKICWIERPVKVAGHGKRVQEAIQKQNG